MRRIPMAVLFALAMTFAAPAVQGQQNEGAARIRTRELLSQLLDKEGPGLHIMFRENEKQPFGFVGLLKEGVTQAESFEVLIGVTPNQTLGFRIYPHYKSGYINVDNVKNSAGA